MFYVVTEAIQHLGYEATIYARAASSCALYHLHLHSLADSYIIMYMCIICSFAGCYLANEKKLEL